MEEIQETGELPDAALMGPATRRLDVETLRVSLVDRHTTTKG
jgi:hypothetical protein